MDSWGSLRWVAVLSSFTRNEKRLAMHTESFHQLWKQQRLKVSAVFTLWKISEFFFSSSAKMNGSCFHTSIILQLLCSVFICSAFVLLPRSSLCAVQCWCLRSSHQAQAPFYHGTLNFTLLCNASACCVGVCGSLEAINGSWFLLQVQQTNRDQFCWVDLSNTAVTLPRC